jgi:hypothetical protein
MADQYTQHDTGSKGSKGSYGPSCGVRADDRDRRPSTNDDVVIFTDPGRVSCEWAKLPKERGVMFAERNLANDSRAVEELTRSAREMLPVVRVGSEIVSGFDSGKLERLLEARG